MPQSKTCYSLTLLALALATGLSACSKPTPPADTAPTPAPTPPPTAATMPAPSSGLGAGTESQAANGGAAQAAEAKVTMNLISDKGVGADVGTVTISDAPTGLQLKVDLKGLPPGEHGFHVHQNADCGAKEKDGKLTAGEAAGEHLDPTQTGKHAGPEGAGHEGDMPRLTVGADGAVTTTITAPRLKLSDVKGHSLMLHSERDDYAAKPGGPRIACGVVPQ